MKTAQWEYKEVYVGAGVERMDIFNGLGRSGWELVAFSTGLAFFKKQKS